MLPQETHLRAKDRHRLTVREWKRYSMKMETKSWGSNTCIRQNRL